MPRVLVVDGDVGVRESSGIVLSQLGHQVITADTGKNALRLTQLNPPDIMLLDLKLPDMNAFELIRTLRRFGARFPIIVMTGFATVQSAVQAMKVGAVDFVEKPLDVDQIADAVERAARLSRGQSRSVQRADGVVLWATAVASVLRATQDPKTLEAWAAIHGVGAETLRSWCRTADLSPKRSLDLARLLRAAYHARTRQIWPERLLHVAHHRTLERLLRGAGLTKHEPAPPLEDLLARQTFIDDTVALEELRRLIREVTLTADT